jgi:hypothetical protein
VDSDPNRNTRIVLIQNSAHIDRPIEAVSSALATAPPGWLPSLVGPDAGGEFETTAGMGQRTKVTIELGDPVTSGVWTEIPITWQATYFSRPFPLMSGKIEVAPNEGRSTTLTVYGSYDAPPERAGEHLSEDVIRRVARAMVKQVAESIARRLESAVY